MICQECGGRFDVAECPSVYELRPYGDGAVSEDMGGVCPVCGSLQIFEERECAGCEQDCAPEELEEGLCRMCVEETLQSLEWMWDMLTPAQRRWACEHTDWMFNEHR